LSSEGRSRNGFLLLGPGDNGPGAAILVGLWGKTERMGVVGLLVPEACRTRKGLVSELPEVDFGITRDGDGAGSSNGDTTATQTSVQPSSKRRVSHAQGGAGAERGGDRERYL
jgi:hypothetical protein